jgi:diguanylate cyclase (GGDEF)-like protein/PAS domain S-box-containing protein
MPDSVPLTGHRVPTARSALDLVEPADRHTIINAWTKVKDEGRSHASVALLGSKSLNASVQIFDVRANHGVFVGIIVNTDGEVRALADAAEIMQPPPRLARTRKDAEAIVILAEPSLTEMLGWDVSEVVGKRSLEFVHPDDHDRGINMWMECLTRPGSTCRSRLRHRHRDGRWIWLEVSNHNLLDDPAFGYVACDMFDISEEMEAHEAVRASEQLLRRLAGALSVGVMQFDLERNLLYANERLYELVGAEPGTNEAELMTCIVDPAAFEDALLRVLGGDDVDMELSIDPIGGGGRRRCTLAMRVLANVDGTVIGGVGCLTDITDAARMRSELERRATYDDLTGCMNRSAVMSLLAAMLGAPDERPGRTGGIAVAFVDLDAFKAVNDQFGHAVGDDLLVAVATRLRGVIRGADVVGRLGGDEFLVMCPDVADEAGARALGARVSAAIASPLDIEGNSLLPTASVGVAWTAVRDGVDAEALIAEADAAMYTAKHLGHGQLVVATSRRSVQASSR